MEDDRIVSSAKKVNDPSTNLYTCIKAVIDSVERFVPLDANNKERILVQAWEDAGNTLADAD